MSKDYYTVPALLGNFVLTSATDVQWRPNPFGRYTVSDLAVFLVAAYFAEGGAPMESIDIPAVQSVADDLIGLLAQWLQTEKIPDPVSTLDGDCQALLTIL